MKLMIKMFDDANWEQLPVGSLGSIFRALKFTRRWGAPSSSVSIIQANHGSCAVIQFISSCTTAWGRHAEQLPLHVRMFLRE